MVATRFSELVTDGKGCQLSNDDLKDQLKYHKLVLKKTGFSVSQPNRKAFVLQLQTLLLDAHGPVANVQ